MSTEFSWNPAENKHLTLEDVRRCVGPSFFEEMHARVDRATFAKSRAHGAWLANERQDFAVFTRYAELVAQ